MFRPDSHHHHLPHVQMRAGGGSFRQFRPNSHHHHLPHVQTQAGGGFFLFFRPVSHHTTSFAFKRELEVIFFRRFDRLPPHHLPRVQTRAGGSLFSSFRPSATTTTSLASKHELEVVVFDYFDATATTPPSSRSNMSRRWFFFVVSTCLPPPPPPSRLNASQRWFISFFRHASHLPRVQAQAGGGFFRCFDTAPTTTSLASERELEVVFFGASTRLPKGM